MSIRIVAYSTCDLPQELLKRLQIKIVPAVICSGDQRYLSGVDIDRELFCRKLQQEDVVPPLLSLLQASFSKPMSRS